MLGDIWLQQHFTYISHTVSLSDVISTEDFLSTQIASASSSDKYLLLSYL
jgi:hypothetical protein